MAIGNSTAKDKKNKIRKPVSNRQLSTLGQSYLEGTMGQGGTPTNGAPTNLNTIVPSVPQYIKDYGGAPFQSEEAAMMTGQGGMSNPPWAGEIQNVLGGGGMNIAGRINPDLPAPAVPTTLPPTYTTPGLSNRPGGASMLGSSPMGGGVPVPTVTAAPPTPSPYPIPRLSNLPGGAAGLGSSPTTEGRGTLRFEDRGPVMSQSDIAAMEGSLPPSLPPAYGPAMDEAGMQEGFGGEYTGLRTPEGREPMNATEYLDALQKARPDISAIQDAVVPPVVPPVVPEVVDGVTDVDTVFHPRQAREVSNAIIEDAGIDPGAYGAALPQLRNAIEQAYTLGTVPDLSFIRNIPSPSLQVGTLEQIMIAVKFGIGEKTHAAERAKTRAETAFTAAQQLQLAPAAALAERQVADREAQTAITGRQVGVQEARQEAERGQEWRAREERGKQMAQELLMQQRDIKGEQLINIREMEQRKAEMDERVKNEANNLMLNYDTLNMQQFNELNEMGLAREMQNRQIQSDNYIAYLNRESEKAIADNTMTRQEAERQLDREVAISRDGVELSGIAARKGVAEAQQLLDEKLAQERDYQAEQERKLTIWLREEQTKKDDADRLLEQYSTFTALKQQSFEMRANKAIAEKQITESTAVRTDRTAIAQAERDLEKLMFQAGLNEQKRERLLRETTGTEERKLARERIDLEREMSERQSETQLALAALQDPFKAAAFARMTGGGLPGAASTAPGAVPTLPGGVTDFGFQNVPVPAQGVGQFFPGGMPTIGALGQATPESLQFLNALLGYSGVSPGQFGRAASGITPQVAQGPGMRMVGAGQPMGVRA